MTRLPNSYSSSGRPSWSPDGTRVAINLNRTPVVVDRETEKVVAQIGPDGANIGAPQFSPTSDQIAYDIYTQTPESDKKQWAIQVSGPKGENAAFVVNHGRKPQWSPDGKTIAFSSYTDDYQTKISTVNSDGTDEKVLSKRPKFIDFSWSADGSHIAYEASNDVTYDLRVHEVATGEERIMTDGDDAQYSDRTPVWSPNGKTIAFERRHKQFPAGSLWSVDLDSGLEKELFQKSANVVDPVYSPDGKSIVFGSNHGGRGGLDLFSMNLEDLSVTQLTDQKGDEHSPSFSPDGSTIAYLNTDRRRPSGERQELHFLDSPGS